MIYERHARLRVAAIDAWASVKSFKKNQKQEPPDDPGKPDGELPRRAAPQRHARFDDRSRVAAGAQRGNGREAKLPFTQHALMENRNGLIVDVLETQASGTAEREAALLMLDEHLPGSRPITLAADRGYHVRDFIVALRERNVTPDIAMVDHQRPAIDKRTTHHPGSRLVGAAYNDAPHGQPPAAPGLIEPGERSAAALDRAAEAGKTPIVVQANFNSLLELPDCPDTPTTQRMRVRMKRYL